MNPDSSFPDVLDQAIEDVLSAYAKGMLTLESEGDLQGHIFCKALQVLRSISSPYPVRVHVAFPLSARRKPDIALVRRPRDPALAKYISVAEVKFEPDPLDPEKYVAMSRVPIVFSASIKADFYKVKDLISNGPFEVGHLVVIDECGLHRRSRELQDLSLPWRDVTLANGPRHLLHVTMRRSDSATSSTD